MNYRNRYVGKPYIIHGLQGHVVVNRIDIANRSGARGLFCHNCDLARKMRNSNIVDSTILRIISKSYNTYIGTEIKWRRKISSVCVPANLIVFRPSQSNNFYRTSFRPTVIIIVLRDHIIIFRVT